MKIFIVVIAIATIVGGFAGGEVMDKIFSILGAAIGGVGTAAILLGLGAYFNAQEEKKKRQNLPPEIKGVFDRMLGRAHSATTPASAWRPRPFHANKSKEDFIEWFSNVPPWSKVDTKIIQILIERFGANPLFEVFVHTSQDQSLIGKYTQLNDIARMPAGKYAVCARIAMILSEAAETARPAIEKALKNQKFDDLKTPYGRAIDSLETAIQIAPNIPFLYLQIGALKAMMGRNEEAKNFCVTGLRVIDEQKIVPFEQSTIESVKNAHAENEKIEHQLKFVLEKVSG